MTRSPRSTVIALIVLVLALVAGILAVVLRPASIVAGQASPMPGVSADSGDPGIGPTEPGPTEPDQTTPQGPVPLRDQPDGATGEEGGGDPYYPDAGNTGYDVQGYQIALDFDPTSKELTATATITAKVDLDERLGRFSFDLQPTMTVSEATVDGEPAAVRQHDAKLQLTPQTGLDPGQAFTVEVSYAGTPGLVSGGTSGLADGGWYTLDSGGAVVIGEPFSASAWYPVNEIPRDRATFAVQATVPEPWKVISNGLPLDVATLPTPPDGSAVFGWQENEPMASYLSTIYIDQFEQTQASSNGITIINAYAPGAEDARGSGDRTGDYLEFLSSAFGPYPFDSSGGIFLADQLGFALETQTRPVYSAGMGESVVVHELAHQWFGDAVTVQSWADICLNECFASYSEWIWAEHNGADLDDRYRQIVAAEKDNPGWWQLPLVDMGPGNEFGDVYSRGPLALYALRNEMGDDAFQELLLSWIEKYSGQSASWSDFADLVDQIAGKDESAFLDAWFVKTGVPSDEFLWPGDLHP